MCICVLRFSLHYINFRWSHKFVYSPLSFHYKYIVSHSTVSHLVRVKDQIKHCKSMEDLSFNFIFCDHHMWPLLHTQNYTSPPLPREVLSKIKLTFSTNGLTWLTYFICYIYLLRIMLIATIISQWLITNIESNTFNRLYIQNRISKIERLCSSFFRSGFSQVLLDSVSGDHEIFILKNVWKKTWLTN